MREQSLVRRIAKATRVNIGRHVGVLVVAGACSATPAFAQQLPLIVWGTVDFNGTPAQAGQQAYILIGGPQGTPIDTVEVGMNKDGAAIPAPYFQELLERAKPSDHIMLKLPAGEGEYLNVHFGWPSGPSMITLEEAATTGMQAYFNTNALIGVDDPREPGQSNLFWAQTHPRHVDLFTRLREGGLGKFDVYGVQGRWVAGLEQYVEAGEQSVQLPHDLPASVYYATMTVGPTRLNTRFVVRP